MENKPQILAWQVVALTINDYNGALLSFNNRCDHTCMYGIDSKEQLCLSTEQEIRDFT